MDYHVADAISLRCTAVDTQEALRLRQEIGEIGLLRGPRGPSGGHKGAQVTKSTMLQLRQNAIFAALTSKLAVNTSQDLLGTVLCRRFGIMRRRGRQNVIWTRKLVCLGDGNYTFGMVKIDTSPT